MKYDEWQSGRQNSSNSSEGASSRAYNENYSEPGSSRYISFVWADGKRVSFNYAYLVTAQFIPEDNLISLSFTTHDIRLTGVNLLALFYDILEQRVRQVTSADERYNIIGENEYPIVNVITLTENK